MFIYTWAPAETRGTTTSFLNSHISWGRPEAPGSRGCLLRLTKANSVPSAWRAHGPLQLRSQTRRSFLKHQPGAPPGFPVSTDGLAGRRSAFSAFRLVQGEAWRAGRWGDEPGDPQPGRELQADSSLSSASLWPRPNKRQGARGSGAACPAQAQALPDWPGFLPSPPRGPADREQRGDGPRQIRVRGDQQRGRALLLPRQPLRAR